MLKKQREVLGLNCIGPFDIFKGQCTAQVLKLLEDNHILCVIIPNSCTDCLQPLHFSVNKIS